jgi:tetratricopeptide (TPR) repeat protein
MNTNTQEKDEIFCLAFQLVRQRLPPPSSDTPEPAKWNVFKEYLPHVVSLQRVYSDSLSIIKPFLGLSELFRDGGVLLWQRYISIDAMKLLNSAEAILNELECDEDNLRVDIHITTNLLIQYFGISHREESKYRLGKILEFRLKVPTTTLEDETLLNNARADYANSLLQFNDYENAEPIYQQCYKKCLEWGPEEANPFDCAKLNHHMAYCLMYRRDFEGAIRLAERAITLIGLFPGADKQLVLRYKFDLACIVLQSGNIKRALELHKLILTARLDLQGRDSYFTLQSYYAVGALFSYLDQLDEAEYVSSLH